jgi:hypothetical protein
MALVLWREAIPSGRRTKKTRIDGKKLVDRVSCGVERMARVRSWNRASTDGVRAVE